VTDLHTEGPWKVFDADGLRRLKPLRTELPERTHEFGVQIPDPDSLSGLRIPGTQYVRDDERDKVIEYLSTVWRRVNPCCSDVLEETIKDLQQGKHR
jgi:hypothetical protein